MATGLKVWAQDGSNALQIDEFYQNLFMRHKGSTATDANDNPTYNTTRKWGVTISNMRNAPIVAIRCAVPCRSWAISTGAGSYELRFVVNGPIGTAIEYYVFDTLHNEEASNYGLKVWNASGTLIFDAARKPMRVIDYLLTINAGTSTYPEGRVYAVAISGGSGQQSFSGGGGAGYVLLVGGGTVVNNSVTISRFQIIGGSGSSFNQSNQFFAMVIDVTNY